MFPCPAPGRCRRPRCSRRAAGRRAGWRRWTRCTALSAWPAMALITTGTRQHRAVATYHVERVGRRGEAVQHHVEGRDQVGEVRRTRLFHATVYVNIDIVLRAVAVPLSGGTGSSRTARRRPTARSADCRPSSCCERSPADPVNNIDTGQVSVTTTIRRWARCPDLHQLLEVFISGNKQQGVHAAHHLHRASCISSWVRLG